MEKTTEDQVPPKNNATEPDRKIEGELTLDELTAVVGGGTVGPIYNGTYYPRFKSRFGDF